MEPMSADARYYDFWTHRVRLVMWAGLLCFAVIEGTLLAIAVRLEQTRTQTIEFEVIPPSQPTVTWPERLAAEGSDIPPPLVAWFRQSISSVHYK
jgi:hypothetical protein